ncbi:MAG: hypothetical protein BWY15_01922 [Firmicutes bacterium ADurb.Bin193]|nr:MAG: hypothetical protein BWY15_01922 [Firmicutes bacterium ADurb.Bin193]
MTSKIKQAAYKFLKEYKIKKLTLERITEIIRSQGYKIIRFGKAYNEKNIEILINGLELKGYVQAYSAFTYTDDKYRLVFLEDNISEDEALILLTHEEGHIYNGHFGETVIAGKNTLDEFEANEFTHYVINPTKISKATTLVSNHKVASIIVSIFVLFAIGVSIANPSMLKHQTYYGNYYVSPTGTRYHKEDCFYIRDKTTKGRVTKEDIEGRNLEPCKVCLPELRDDE